MSNAQVERTKSFGEGGGLTPVDRFGVWLSKRRINKAVGSLAGRDVGDFGCGHDATFMRSVLKDVESVTLVDVSLAPDLLADPCVRAVEGHLPDALEGLADESLDVVLCISVLEHLWDPEATLAHARRLLRPGGICAVSVPSWWGKRALEFSAFRLGLSPACEMDDHKHYFDPRDFWPLMVRAGFQPHAIKCTRYKFGLNTFAIGTLDRKESDT